MASVKRIMVVTINGKNYEIGDGVILRLKTGKVLVGIINQIILRLKDGVKRYIIVLAVDYSLIEIDVDMIDD